MEEVRVNDEVQTAFEEMMDISTDIDKAVMFGRGGVLASNLQEPVLSEAVGQAQELVAMAEAKALEMGGQPFTQLAIDTGAGHVFLSREQGEDKLTILATGKKGSRVGLALYDLKTCLRDAAGVSKVEAPKGRKKKEG
jgi:predicted regulator of Ras-like GTPase activity (Roadblock/LC7/MglB family)